MSNPQTAEMKNIILEVQDLKVTFAVTNKGKLFAAPKTIHAVNGVSFKLYEQETLGIVGESGCGKSTLSKAILRLIEDNATVKGKVVYLGQDITTFGNKAMKSIRKHMQVVFQDPLASLDSRMTIAQIIEEPLLVYKPELSKFERLEKVKRVMQLVGLNLEVLNRYPHEFSGGQNQRVGIARAVILEPKLLICDEAVSALDVSIKSQIINLLQKLKQELKMSMLFISHDLSIVRYISDRVMVLYLGEIMELATAEDIYNRPQHPYTKGLIAAVPLPDPEVEKNKQYTEISGEIPSLFEFQIGCPFASRCPVVFDKCGNIKPELLEVNKAMVACHRVLPKDIKSA